MQSLNLNMKNSYDALLALIVCTGVTRSISVFSSIDNVPTVMTMRYLVPHTLTHVKEARASMLPTPLIPSLEW